ncbi:MAG: DNA polymerase IV, partial [Candidatus Micrarchaeaceae archaeon]
ARRYGIHSGMPISMAYRLKPDAVFLPVDDAYYENMSSKVMTIIKKYADRFEQASIDEAFVDVSESAEDYAGALKIANAIKEEIRNSLGLPCSIGIGPSKLIAKMACEAAKPNGIKLVKESEAKNFIADMPVSKLYGIGKKTAAKLESEGFKTVKDLANANVMKLIDEFGVYGSELYKAANGIDESKLQENYEIKSIGREHTFETNTSNVEEIKNKIRELSKEVAQEVKKQGFAFTIITLKIRYASFDERLKSKSLNYASDEQKDIELAAVFLLEKNYDGSEPIRKIGVRVSGLVQFKGQRKLESYW